MTEDIYDFIPGWVCDLINNKTATYGGGVYVKSPPNMKGLRCVSVGIPHRAFSDNIEEVARKNGWCPISYRQWSHNEPGGSISFGEVCDKWQWDLFFGRW